MAKTIDTLKSASIFTKAGANTELAEAIVNIPALVIASRIGGAIFDGSVDLIRR